VAALTNKPVIGRAYGRRSAGPGRAVVHGADAGRHSGRLRRHRQAGAKNAALSRGADRALSDKELAQRLADDRKANATEILAGTKPCAEIRQVCA
jgi:hypothetical protein